MIYFIYFIALSKKEMLLRKKSKSVGEENKPKLNQLFLDMYVCLKILLYVPE